MRTKFLRPVLTAALGLVAAVPALAQDSTNLSNYQGPGILSRGVGDVGSRGGEQLDLRYYAGVSGIVDTNLQPFVLDAHGNLVRVHNLYGIELNGGAYGVHNWKRSQLGLDFTGTYHHYFNQDFYNGSDQNLTLGYTHQSSRRLAFDLHQSAGTYSIANSQVVAAATSDPSAFIPTSLLFDSRTYFLQSSAFATWTQSVRTSFTAGGTAFLQDRKDQGLTNSWGYDVTGSANRRLSKASSIGVTFVHSHYEFPGFHSQSNSNAYHGKYATLFGRSWTFSLEAGVTVSEVDSQVTLALNPVIAAILGQATITGNTYTRNIYPSGEAKLSRHFRHASLAFDYVRGLSSGNGAYASTRREDARVAFSYTALRKLNLGLDGGHYALSALGQSIGPTSVYTASTGFTYDLGHSVHLSTRYDFREQHIDLPGYHRTSSRATLGLVFSPGSLPLALW